MKKVQRSIDSDRRIKKTKRVITHALANLLIEKELSDITVTELCLAADINRKTFYMHFSSLEETLQYIIDRISHGFADILQEHTSASGYQLHSSILSQLKALNDDFPYYQALANGSAYEKLYMEILQNMEETRLKYTHSSDATVRTVLRFLHGAYLATLTDWLREPAGRTFEDVSDFYIKCALQIRKAYRIDDVVL